MPKCDNDACSYESPKPMDVCPRCGNPLKSGPKEEAWAKKHEADEDKAEKAAEKADAKAEKKSGAY